MLFFSPLELKKDSFLKRKYKYLGFSNFCQFIFLKYIEYVHLTENKADLTNNICANENDLQNCTKVFS